MKPTDICLRSECREENWRRSWIREPLPKEFVIEAWKARVGKSFERERTQAACFCRRCQFVTSMQNIGKQFLLHIIIM